MIPVWTRSFWLRSLTTSVRSVTRLWRAACLNPKNLGVNIKTLLYQVPGGMLSNLTSQLKEQHAEDKFYEVLGGSSESKKRPR